KRFAAKQVFVRGAQMNTTVQYDIRSDKLRREMETVLARSPHVGATFNFRTEPVQSPKPKSAPRKPVRSRKQVVATK
ncbi:hypothetical protein, partial [Brevundimonas sp.]